MKHIYETTVINDEGLAGNVTAENGFSVGVAPVLKADKDHTNPEQLLGASWATCLNATIRSILKAKGLENRSKVVIKITLWFDERTRYSFTLDAKASIENMSLTDVQEIVDKAHKYCPVSKLIGDKEGVTLSVENF